MSYEISNYSVRIGTLTAGADLSSAQYTFVKLDSAGAVVQCSAVTDIPLGVLQNAPASGDVADVLVVGGTKVKAGAAITAANLNTTCLSTSAAGLAVAKTLGTDTTNHVVGRPLNASGASGDIITAVINCTAANRAV